MTRVDRGELGRIRAIMMFRVKIIFSTIAFYKAVH